MDIKEIRRQFLEAFKSRGHTVVPSSSVIPHDDPTLLFMNAGMNQFKDVFLGKAKREYSRATSSQKCIRVGGKHNDLDNVGHTSRHMTFFEMLGNFSFGDYFKKEAIAFAWEVTTQVFRFPPDKIWVSVFETDDEAYDLWKAFVPEERIVRFGESENFWSMGETGPCGPCSELLFDRGEAFGSAASPLEDPEGERYLEFWNLVFMEFNREKGGKMTPLEKKSIDTGAGLERIAALSMGVESVFETDVLRALIHKVEEISGITYDKNDSEKAPAFHVIADHLRSLSFAIADGATPSNIERGYVLRKILRRAVRYGRLLGLRQPFLAKLLPILESAMGEDFPELISSRDRIAEILTSEEEGFLRTLQRGGNILQQVMEKALKSPKKEISGEDAFKLKDTYGFPLEEILLLAKDAKLKVNLDSFSLLEEQAKEKSRSAQSIERQELEKNLFSDFVAKHGPSEFVGYDEPEEEGSILALVVGGKFVKVMNEGESGLVVLDKTPFYAEKGGQIGDVGKLLHDTAHFQVTDTKSPYSDVIIHEGKLKSGVLLLGEPVTAEINERRRNRIAKNHTATHLLHYALQQVLGPHVSQAGSYVDDERLRFDFNHHKSVSKDEVQNIERLVNEKIREASPVETYTLSYEEAQARPDIKQFFGDKYGNQVRVVDIKGYSQELCGGTHINRTGKIGLFRIVKEMSIAKGVRRIEAVTGKYALEFMHEKEILLDKVSVLLNAPLSQVEERITSLSEENKRLQSACKQMRSLHLSQYASRLMDQVQMKCGIQILSCAVDILPGELIPLGNDLMGQMQSGAILLASKAEGKCQLLVKVSKDLIEKGFKAGVLIKKIAPLIGGSGGGRPESAQAGGARPEGIEEAIQAFTNLFSK